MSVEQMSTEQEESDLPIDKLVEIAEKAEILVGSTKEERWKAFIQGIQLHDIVHDCILSSLRIFEKEYNKKHPEENIKFNLLLRKRKPNKKEEIFGVSLVLEMRRFDTYKVLYKKDINFTHVRDFRATAGWKYALFGALFNSIVETAINHLMLTDDVVTGRIKSDVPEGKGTAE